MILSLILLICIPTNANAQTGLASWYGHPHHGKKTASGERFNMRALTAAHRSMPFGTRLRVSYMGKSVVVRVNDRGPFVRGRIIDLSKAAADSIGCTAVGVCRVSIQRL